MGDLGADLQALARAVAQGGPAPRGIDEKRARIVREQLVRKRVAMVARYWPSLAAELGDELLARAAGVLRSLPFDASRDAVVGGLLVGEPLRRAGRLGPAAEREVALAAGRWRVHGSGVARRRGVGAVVRVVHGPPTFVVMLRADGREWTFWFRLPLVRRPSIG